MNKSVLKKLTIACMCILSFSAFAQKLSLSDLRSEILDENIDIKVQYEKFYQGQKNIGVAMGDFLPRLSFNLFFFNSTYAILNAVVPTPSNWFNYQASKELAVAQKYTSQAIRLNILEGLTRNYIEIKKSESIINTLNEREIVLEEVYQTARRNEDLGVGSANDTFTALRALNQVKQDIYIMGSLLIALKESLLISLNRTPDEQIELGELPEIDLDIPATNIEAQNEAINNSPELISNYFMGQAAQYMVSSARWSFISFDGIGFGYPSQLAIEKSKSREISLIGEQTENKIRNQVYVVFEELQILDQRIHNQNLILDLVKMNIASQEDLYSGGLMTFSEFSKLKLDLIAEEQSSVNLEFEKRLKLAELKRLLGRDASLVNLDMGPYVKTLVIAKTLKHGRRVAKLNLSLGLDKSALENIYSVSYKLGNSRGYRTTNSSSAFAYNIKLTGHGIRVLDLKIQLMNGKIINKSVTVFFDANEAGVLND